MTLHPARVIVYGTIALDRFIYEATDRQEERAGGEAFNTAVALDGWGVPTLLAGTQLGADAEGKLMRRLLDAPVSGFFNRWEGNDAAPVTPCCTIRVTADGERTMSGRGFAQAVAPPLIPAVTLSNARVFVCDRNLGDAADRQALAAHETGCELVSMDFFDEEIIARSRIFVTSPEALRRFHVPHSSPEEYVRRWCDMGAQTAILTLGATGGVACDRDAGFCAFPACSVREIVDTTGAGDTFRAGLVYGLLQNWSLLQTLDFAAAAAALHCSKLGAASRASVEDVFAFSSSLPHKIR